MTRLSRRGWIAAAVMAAALAIVGQRQFGTHNTPAGQPALMELRADGLDALRAEFNSAANSVRLIVLLSPT